jgi:FG-GAP-like repeat/FG-GAP repeat
MRNLLTLLLFYLMFLNVWALDSFDTNNGQLTIPLVDVNGTTYTNVVVTVGQVLSIGSAPANGNNDVFNTSNGQLIIPSVIVGSSTFFNVVASVSKVLSVGSTMPTGTTTVFYNVSPTPDLSELGLPTTPYYFQYNNFTFQSTYLSNVLGAGPSGEVFTKGQDKLNHVFVFPSYDNNSNYQDSIAPTIPIIEFVEYSPNIFIVKKIIKDIGLGVARSWSLINTKNYASNEFVVVDSGHEPLKLPYSSWPYGYVWHVKDTGNGFQFSKLSKVATFNHSVAVGDLNGDGLDDIAVGNMGNRIDCPYQPSLEIYIQQKTNFINDTPCITDSTLKYGSGAVAIGDVLGLGNNQIVQVNYFTNNSFGVDWGGVRFLKGSSVQNLSVLSTIPRQGLFLTMGATQVIPFDYDQDGKLDLLISFEGSNSDNGIEIFKNLGSGNFQLVTNQLIDINKWNFSDLQFRECQIADLNGDGFPDIVIQGWNGLKFKINQGTQFDVGPLIMINQRGKSFKPLTGTASTIISVDSWTKAPQYLRYMDTNSNTGFSRLWGIRGDGTPVTITFKP